jgi:hypothetical protein
MGTDNELIQVQHPKHFDTHHLMNHQPVCQMLLSKIRESFIFCKIQRKNENEMGKQIMNDS